MIVVSDGKTELSSVRRAETRDHCPAGFLRHLRRIYDRDAVDLGDSRTGRYLAFVINASVVTIFDGGLDGLLRVGIGAAYCVVKSGTAAQYRSAR